MEFSLHSAFVTLQKLWAKFPLTLARHNDWWLIINLSTLRPSVPWSNVCFEASTFCSRRNLTSHGGKKKDTLSSTLLESTGQSPTPGFWPLGPKCPQNHLISHPLKRLTDISSHRGVRRISLHRLWLSPSSWQLPHRQLEKEKTKEKP